jgi:hypothetical protein
VHDVLAPVDRTVEPLTDAVHDVVAPVRTALAPVTDTVGVVTRSLAPVLEAVLSPVVNAVAPVPEPDSGSGGAGRPGWQVGATVDASPAGGHSGGCSGSGYLGNRSGVDGHGDRTGHRARCARVLIPETAGVTRPGKAPSAPVAPLNAAPSGGSGSVGGSGGGSHGADAAVSAGRNSPADDNGWGRSPPGAIVGHPWFGYDSRDHPR